MEMNFGSWSQHQLSDRQSPHLNTLAHPFNLGQQNTFSAHLTSCTDMVPSNEGIAFSGVPHSNMSLPNEPQGRFSPSPHFRQTFPPIPNSFLRENCEVVVPNLALGSSPKRFLVFDQSGDKTTLIYSSWGPKLDNAHDLNNIVLPSQKNIMLHLEPILADEYNENCRDDTESEMHEDSEELDALLYSDEDDDYCSEDDETASTGHSPSIMTGNVKKEWLECAEEVASSVGPSKKMKRLDKSYDAPYLADTASSLKQQKCSEYEDDDAESSHAGGQNQDLREPGPLLGNKRSRKEKIQETLSILREIIPGGQATDAIGMFDEAINYLSTLKHMVGNLQADAR